MSTTEGGLIEVIGGEDPALAGTVLPGQSGIFYGSGSTQYVTTYPSATIAAWETFIASVTVNPTSSFTGISGISATATASQTSPSHSDY